MPAADGTPTWEDQVNFWKLAQQAHEQTRQDALGESRADRRSRLTIANNQLRAQREQIAISRGQAEADRWYKEQQVSLAREESQRGREQFAQTHLLEQQKLASSNGLELMKLRAGLKGPGDWAQFLDAGEGWGQLQGASGFLSNIAGGKDVGSLDVAFGGDPTRSTLQGLATPTADQQRARVNADMGLAKQIAGNVGKVKLGALDAGNIGQDRLDYLLGLAGQQGFSAQTLMDSYERNKPGQGNAFAY